MDNYHQAPPALLCIHWKDFLPQHDSKFAYQDIRESQLEKMVAYAQGLQFWVEKANLPTLGQPCLLVGSILELREAMKCYISFPNDAIFGSMALPHESLTIKLEKTIPESTQPVSTDSPIEEGAVKVANQKGTLTKLILWVEGSVTSLQAGHCHWAVLQSPKVPNGDLIAKILGKGWLDAKRHRNSYRFKTQGQSPHCQWDPGNCTGSEPPPGFWGVTEAPPDPLQLAAVVEYTVVTMSVSCIVKDEATGITYMDTMTTSVG